MVPRERETIGQGKKEGERYVENSHRDPPSSSSSIPTSKSPAASSILRQRERRASSTAAVPARQPTENFLTVIAGSADVIATHLSVSKSRRMRRGGKSPPSSPRPTPSLSSWSGPPRATFRSEQRADKRTSLVKSTRRLGPIIVYSLFIPVEGEGDELRPPNRHDYLKTFSHGLLGKKTCLAHADSKMAKIE